MVRIDVYRFILLYNLMDERIRIDFLRLQMHTAFPPTVCELIIVFSKSYGYMDVCYIITICRNIWDPKVYRSVTSFRKNNFTYIFCKLTVAV